MEGDAVGVGLAGFVNEVLRQSTPAEGDIALLPADANVARLGVSHRALCHIPGFLGQGHTQLQHTGQRHSQQGVRSGVQLVRLSKALGNPRRHLG